MNRRIASLLLLAVVASTGLAREARAQACVGGHCDYLIARSMITGENCGTSTFDPSQTVEYSQLVTGARDFDTFPIANLYPVVVFDERLDGTFSADDPGFSAVPSPCNDQPTLSPLPSERDLFVDFLTIEPTAGGAARNLLYWDGVDDDMNGLDENDVDWSPVPIDEIFRFEELGTIATADGGTSEIPGLFIEQTSITGNIHDHVDFELRRSGGGLATIGVYLLRIDLTMPGFAEGAPSYMVFSTPSTQTTPVSAEFVARTHVENNLVEPLCNDGVDNDRDGFVDFAGGDPGCSSAADDSEKDASLPCDDGIDNDLDGQIDFRADSFGVADLYAERDVECFTPSDPSGETVTPVPTIPPQALWVLACGLAAAARRLTALRA